MPSTTLNYTATMGSAFAESVGHYKQLGRSATEAECKEFIIAEMKAFHRREQKAIQDEAPSPPITELVMT